MEIRLKRFLSLAMAIIMVIGMMPTNVVFAEEVSEEEPAHVCEFTIEEITKAATCTEAGEKKLSCSCGDSYTEEISALGHSYAEEVTKEATCTEAGEKTFTCGVCGDSYTEEISALGHSYAEEVTKEATCTEAGEKTITFTCGCGDSYTEEISALGHSYAEEVTKEATCTEAGEKTFTCGVCGDSYTEAISALGHSYEAGECECGAVDAEWFAKVEQVQAMIDALPELPPVVKKAELEAYQAKVNEITAIMTTMTDEQIAQLTGLEKLYPTNITVEAPTGTLTNCYTSDSTYWGECGGNASESFEFKFYHNDTYMGYTSLNNVDGIIDGDVYVSWHIKLDAASNTDEYWTMAWDIQPTIEMQPTRVEQWVDGVKVAEAAVEPNWSDRIYPVVAAVTDDNGTILSYVNGTEGHTLADAVAAGGNITLLKDVEASEAILIGKSLTINGNGHKVTSSASRVFRITASNVDVTLNDVDMVSNAVRTGTNDIRGISIDASLSNVKLTLTNCSVDFTDASANDWAYAVNVSGSGTGHTLTVDGGSYEGANVINVHGANNTVTVKNATLTSNYPYNEMYWGACIWVLEESGSSVTATGNTFNGTYAVSFNVGTGTALTESGNTINTGMEVAKVDGMYYASLADAVAAGGEVKVLKDIVLTEGITIPAGKTVVLDLGGNTISYTSIANGWDALIKNSGDLTIKDSAENGKLIFTPTHTSTNYSSDTIENVGVLTVLGGTIENTVGSDASYAIHNNSSNSNATLTVEGGKIIGVSTAIRQYVNSASTENNVTISKATISGAFPVRVQVFAANGKGKLVVDSGTLTSSDYYAIAVQGYNNCSGKYASVEVKGGTLNGSISVDSVSDMANRVAISGGTITGAYGAYDFTNTGAITITGGTFNASAYDYFTYYMASSHEAIENADGTYTVVLKKVDVKVENVQTQKPEGVTDTQVNNIIAEVTESKVIKEVTNLPENTTLVIKPVSVVVEEPDKEHNDSTTVIVTTKITYDVTPVVNGVEMPDLGQEVTFRLPIPGTINSYITQAVVTHKGVSVTKDILPKNAQPGEERYVEVSSSNFSPFEVELIDISSADVAKIGNKGYETLDAALTAAKAANMTEVEIEILGDCTFSTKVSGFKKVTFTGTERKQNLTFDHPNNWETSTALVFNDLTVTRVGKDWLYGNYYANGGQTFNNCKMVGSFSVSKSNANFTGCTFYNDDTYGNGNYNLWMYNCYDGVTVNITNCEFDVYERAIKMYIDGGYSGVMTLNISGSEFKSRTADKPVVQMSYSDNFTGKSFMQVNISSSEKSGFGTPAHKPQDAGTNAWFDVEGNNGTASIVTVDGKMVYTDCAAMIGTQPYLKLQDAIAAVKNNETITLIADCNENVTISQVADKSFTIDGAKDENDKYSFSGTIYLEGNSRYTGAETLTIKNINFTTAKDTHDFISCNDGGTEQKRYAHNVTVENCTFTATGSGAAVVAMRYRQCYNMTVKNCTATNIHSLMWANGTTGITIENVKATGCKEGGVSIGTSTKVTIKGCEFDGADHGIRADGVNSYLTVENCKLTATTPIYVRAATAEGQTLNLNGTNTLTSTTDGAKIVLNKDNVPKVSVSWAQPEVRAIINVNDTALAATLTEDTYKEIIKGAVQKSGNLYLTKAAEAMIGSTYYDTLAAAVTASKIGDTIKLLKDVDLSAGMSILEKNLTLDLNGKTFKGDVLGTIAINGGTYITSQNYKMMGPDADYYKTTDAVFSMTDIKGSITLHSGNVIMVPAEWWTLEGQTLTIDAGATFEIPAGKTLQVLSTVIVNGTVKVDGTVNLYIASATVKAAEGLNIVTSVADHKVVYQDGTYKVVPKTYVAQIGETKYESVADALAAAVEAGMTDVTITLIGETTQASAVALNDAFNLYTLEKFNSVTINQADATKPYYIADIYTGSRTNGGKFIFDGVNITVIDQYIFEGNVALTNNSVVKSVTEHNCFNYYGNVTVEPGSKLLGVIDEARGGKYTIDGGKTDGSYNTTPDMQDAILSISWNGDSITLKNGAYVKVNAADEIGRMTLGAGAVANIVASKLDAWEYINMAAGSAMNMDTESLITTKKVTGTGVITIDAANMTESVQVINADMSGFAGTIEVINNEYALYEITETGVMVVVGVASVNGKAYKTLTDAFAAVNENTEESVVMNINAGTYAPTANEQLIVTRDNVTIQGAGQDKTTIACGDFTCAGQAGLLIQGSNVTVKDLTVTSSATNAIKVTKIENNNSLPMVKNVAITNVTATSTKGHGLNLHGVEGAAINGLTATGSKCGIALASATGVEISGTKAAGSWVGGTASIGMMYADGAAYAIPCELTLGENNELGLIYSERSTEAKDEITLTATAPATLRINNLTVAAGEEFLPEGVTEAKVGNYYASLANAMAVAKEGDTVELLTDVEIGTQLVLDKQLITLSGGKDKHTIKAADGFVKGEYSKHMIDVRADGIVVKDLFIDGNNLASGIQFYGCQANIGNVTVENAKGWAAMQLNGAMLEIFDDVDVSSTSNTWPLIAVEYGAHNPARETVLIVSTDATVDGTIYIDPNGAKLAESQGVSVTATGNLKDENVAAVAKVGSTYYGSLESAVREAANGKTVEVLADITLTERIEITKDVILAADKPVTITVSIASGSTGEPFGGLHVTNGTLSLWRGVTVTNVGSQDGGVSTITATGANANVIVDGATVKSECKNNAIEASNGAYITINGGEVLGTQYTAAYASGGATIEVKAGTVKAEGKYGLIASKTAATTGGKLIISGGEVTNVLAHESADSSATITGGKIYGSVNTNHSATIHITAGWFEKSPLNKTGVTLDPGMTWSEDNKYIHHASYIAFVDADNDGIVDEGEQGFTTIEAALAAEGKTVKLLNNLTSATELKAEKEVTIDLNGYDVTLNKRMEVKANVNLTASKPATVTVSIDSGSSTSAFGGLHVTNGTLTLGENVTVTNVGSKELQVSTITTSGANAKVVVNEGATVKSECKNNAIEAANGSYVTVNGGSVIGTQFTAAYASGGATIEVKAGRVDGSGWYGLIASKTAATTGGKLIVSGGEVTHLLVHEAADSSAVISGGTIIGNVRAEEGAKAEITGGRVTGNLQTADEGKLVVSGGIFENPVPEKYCAPGYIPCENENGTYGVVLNTTRIIDLSNVHDNKINASEIFVDGVEYTIENNKIEIDRELAKKATMFVTSYEYKSGTAGEYPSAMYVWFVKGVDNDGDGICDTYAAERVSALDNFFQYHGTSIRVGSAKNGIRFFSSVNAADAEKLMKGNLITSGNLSGAKMVSTGTWFKITNEGRSEVYGGAVGSTFRVFQTDNGRNWFTGVLTGLDSNAAKVKEKISSRPYADIQIGGETVSLYGGIVVRSIYDVALQNKDTFTAGTAHDDFVENLINMGKQ